MSTITKEWLQKAISQHESMRDEIPFGLDEDDSNTLAALRIALASLEAVPYGYVHKAAYEQAGSCGLSSDHEAYRDSSTHVAVYTAPPAPAVPGAATAIRACMEEFPESVHDIVEECAAIAENACLAAMFQGADGKPELTVWYGAMPETNGKTNWTAILHRKGECISTGITIDRSEYPDRTRYEADRMRYLIGEISEKPDILAYDADAHSGYVKTGNSPVIPDCWVACSERMPEEGSKVIVFRPRADESNDPPVKTATYKGGREYYHGFDCYCEPTHWMPLPAAPQQET